MTREIKFRGFNEVRNLWMFGYFFKYPNGRTVIYESDSSCCGVLPSTVGQYTGLKDKNGKEIYEGDILSQGQDLLGVACISMRYGISVKKKTTTWSLINFVLDSDFDTSVLSDVEVVGNIYDNPELLKGGE